MGDRIGDGESLEMVNTVGAEGKKEIDSRSGETCDQIGVCLDDNGFLCRGQIM